MADQKLRYTIEVDAAKATPELRKFLDNVGATARSTETLSQKTARWDRELAKIDKSLGNVDRLLDNVARGRASQALAVQLPLWQRLALGVTGVNQALSLLDRTVGRAGRALVSQFAGVANEADRLLTLSRRFDLPVEQIGRLDFVARRAGVSFEGLGQGVRLFATQLTAARSGQEQAVRLFRALGIEGDALNTLAARGLVPAFLQVAQRLSQVNDGTTQAAIGSRLFRGSWDALKVVLADVNGDLEGAAKRADALGAVMSDDLARAADRMKDAFFDLGAATQGLFARLAEAGVFDAMARGIDAVSEAIANIPDEAVTELGNAFLRIADEIVPRVLQALSLVGRAVSAYTAVIERGALLDAVRNSPEAQANLSSGDRFIVNSRLGELNALLPEQTSADLFVRLKGALDPVGQSLATVNDELGQTTLEMSLATDELDRFTPATIESGEAMVSKGAKGADVFRGALADLDLQLAVLQGRLTQQEATDAQFLARFAGQVAPEQLEQLRAKLDLIRSIERQNTAAEAAAKAAGEAEKARLKEQAEALARFERSAFDIFDAIGGAADTMFDAIARGTLDIEQAFDSLKVGIVRSFADAFKQGFAEKIGFENRFRVNITQFVKNIGGILTGKGTGTGGLFGGVFGPQVATGTGRIDANSFTVQVPQYDTSGQQISSAASGIASTLGGLGGSLAGLVSIIGSLYSLATTFQGQLQSARNVRKQTGDNSAANSQLALSTVFTSISANYFAGVGAAVGSVIVPGIGTVVGAALGAAIGAAIGQAITGAINGAINKATASAVKNGLTQEQLNRDVGKDTVIQLATGGLSTLFPNALQFLIPSIDSIFEKLFQQLLGKAGLSTADQAARNPLSSLSRNTQAVLRENARTNFQLGRILAVLIGAGEQRGLPFSRILQVAAGQKSELTNQDVQQIVFQTFRRVFEGSFADAFRFANILGPKARTAVGEAFAPAFPAADFGVITTNLAAGADARGNFFSRKLQKQAAEASVDVFSGLVGGDTLAEFGEGLTDVVSKSFAEAMSGTLANVFGPLLLGELFQVSRQAARKLRRDGVEALPGVVGDFTDATRRTLSNLTEGGVGATLEDIARSIETANEAIELFGLAIAATTGDFDELREAIEGAVAEELRALREFRSFVDSIEVRTGALSGSPFGALQAARDTAFQNRAGARAQFTATIGFPFDISYLDAFIDLLGRLTDTSPLLFTWAQETLAIADLIEQSAPEAADRIRDLVAEGLGISLAVFGFWQEAIEGFVNLPVAEQAETVRELYEASLAYLEAEVELQNARIQFYGQAKKTFQDLIDQVSVIRFGRFGQRGIFDRLSGELPGLAADLRSEDESVRAGAITRLQEIGPQLIQLASQLFAPGSAAFVSFLNLLEPLLGEAFDVSSTALADAEARKANAQAIATELSLLFTPLMTSLETQLGSEVGNKLIDIYRVLGGEGPAANNLLGVLTAIANGNDLATQFPEPRALGGPVTRGYPYIVGEHGPELFVPSTSGMIQPNPNAMPGTLSVTLGDVDVQVSSTLTTGAIVDVVVDALVRKTRPDLTRAVQVAMGAR